MRDLRAELAEIIDRHFDEYRPRYNAEGVCIDSNIVDAVIEALVPAHGILVAFDAEQQTESDWELGYSTSYTDLTSPEVLTHRLSERELAELYFQIEAVGTLGESNAYGDLDKLIEKLGEKPAERARTHSAEPLPGLGFDTLA